MSKKAFSVIILAAGKGTRMKSPLPKVLHPVAGRPMIQRVLDAVKGAGASEVRIVVGHGEVLVRQLVEPLGAICFKQESQRGTADAVKAAMPADLTGPVLILSGDHPLITSKDVTHLLKEYENSSSDLSVVTCELKNPGSFGRIVRHKGDLRAIVEAKDASADTLKIKEVNTALYLMDAKVLNKYLNQIEDNNVQGEYYFTDIVSLACDGGEKVTGIKTNRRVAFGVNSQNELSAATRYIFKSYAKHLQNQGVMVMDPTSTFIEDTVEVGAATVIYPNTHIRGYSKVGSFCLVEPNTYIIDSEIADSVQIKAGSYIEESKIEQKAAVGPYAHLRPQTHLGEETKIGNFVEIKKAKLAKGVKASHLSYIGDAEIGEGTNIGCGTITCNYAADKKKYKTIIGKNVFVGSDSQFVAPVQVGDNAIVGSGSTITKDVPSGALAVARSRQFVKENYKPKAPTQTKVKNQENEA